MKWKKKVYEMKDAKKVKSVKNQKKKKQGNHFNQPILGLLLFNRSSSGEGETGFEPRCRGALWRSTIGRGGIN